MEALSLLKHRKLGGGGNKHKHAAAGASTVLTVVDPQPADTDGEEGDDGPFFDLEFAALPEEGEDGTEEEEEGHYELEEADENVVSDCTDDDDERDRNLSVSPSEDLFFKGKLVPLDSSSSLVFDGPEPHPKNHLPVSLLKSATKLRVFMLRFKKSKSNTMEKPDLNGSTTTLSAPKSEPQKSQEPAGGAKSPLKKQSQTEQSKSRKEQSSVFAVKLKVEEVPIVSRFTRDNSTSRTSSGSNTNGNNSKAEKQSIPAATDESGSDEKRFSKDVLMQKYLKVVKPLYVRASKKYGEKLRFSGHLSFGSGLKCGQQTLPVPVPSTVQTGKRLSPTKSASFKSESEGAEEPEASAGNVMILRNIPAGFRVVCKRLGKSRSASAAVAAVPAAAASAAAVASKRRDDSLLEQQDGIQSAILHCKRSFNGSTDSESTLLSRSTSDPSHEKSMDLSRGSSEESSKAGLE